MFEGKEEGHPDGNENEIRFLYNRAERIKNAPKIVQDYYNGNFELQKGVKVLFRNRSNKFLLITLFTLTAFAVVFGLVDKNQNKGKIGDYKIELASFSYEDEIYSTVKILDARKPKKQAEQNRGGENGKGKKEPAVFSVEFRAVNIDGQVVDIQKEERLLQNEEETFRAKTTDFDISEMHAVVAGLGESVELYCYVKR